MVRPLLLVAGTGKAQEPPQYQSIIMVLCLLCLTKNVNKYMVKLTHQDYIALDTLTKEMSLAKLTLEVRGRLQFFWIFYTLSPPVCILFELTIPP